MPRLILLNGPPGAGKSTLAGRYVDDHPLALNLDIDRVRSLLGRWQDTPGEAGLAARAIALAAARVHLGAGHDVIVPQLLARPAFLRQLDELATDVGVPFVEIMLLDDKDEARRRLARRTELALDPAHIEAAEQLRRSGGAAQFDAYHDDLAALLFERPRSLVIRTREGEVELAYRDVLAAVESAGPEVQAR